MNVSTLYEFESLDAEYQTSAGGNGSKPFSPRRTSKTMGQLGLHSPVGVHLIWTSAWAENWPPFKSLSRVLCHHESPRWFATGNLICARSVVGIVRSTFPWFAWLEYHWQSNKDRLYVWLWFVSDTTWLLSWRGRRLAGKLLIWIHVIIYS